MSTLAQKLSSRKFWFAAAAFLASLGTAIASVASDKELLAAIATACTILSAAIYAGCEAYVDGKRLESTSTQTQTITNISASSNSKELVQQVLAPEDAKVLDNAA